MAVMLESSRFICVFRARAKRPPHRGWFVLFATAALADTVATLYFQSPEYWAGNYAEVADANPVVVAALRVSPWFAVPGYLGWIGGVGFVGGFLTTRSQSRIFLVLTIAHLVFVLGWVVRSLIV